MPLKLEELMVKDVITVEAKATVRATVELMNKHEIGCLVVVDGEKPAGIVTERDMLKRVLVQARNPMLTEVVRSCQSLSCLLNQKWMLVTQ